MNQRQQNDRDNILEHIHSIFSAFIRQDRAALRKLHAKDWVGFLGPSTGIERGLDAYMVNAEKSLQNFKGVSYELLDLEIQLHGDVAIVYYVARYNYKAEEGEIHAVPLRSIDVYRRDPDGWNQAGSHITVIPSGGAWGEGDDAAEKS